MVTKITGTGSNLYDNYNNKTQSANTAHNTQFNIHEEYKKSRGVSAEPQYSKTQTSGKNPQAVKEYLEKDTNYQEWKEYYKQYKADFFAIGRKYNIEPGDIDAAKKLIKDPEELQKYITSAEILYNERNSLQKYEEEIANWKDGPLDRFSLVRMNGEAEGTGSNYGEFRRGEDIIVQHNSRQYTNVERITLSNGQHAWKSDQGVFYPWSNGKIGLDEVPPELLN